MIQFWMQFTQFPMAVYQRINSLYATFIWKSNAHKMSWEDVCKNKSEGGFGIHRIEEVAKVIAVKLLWNYLQDDSLWEKWMCNKYCNNKNFQTVVIGNNASYTWKSMLRARLWCTGLTERKIATGENTDIWFDPWLNGSSLVDKFGWNFMSVSGGRNRKVSALISGNNWKDHLEFIPTQIQNAVYNIEIHDQKQQDFQVWTPNSNGLLSMKSAWNHTRTIHVEFRWASIIWDKFCTPKVSICSLIANLNKLNAKDKISRWNNATNQTCMLYMNYFEDRNHLFFNCSNSSHILDGIMQKLRINIGNPY